MISREKDQELRGIIANGDWSVEQDKAVFYMGGKFQGSKDNREYANDLRAQGYQTIADSPAGKQLDAALPHQAVASGEVSGAEYDYYWSAASHQFARSQSGNVTTRVVDQNGNNHGFDRDGSAAGGMFRFTEMEEVTRGHYDDGSQNKITSINGRSREDFEILYKENQESCYNKICIEEAKNGSDYWVRNSVADGKKLDQQTQDRVAADENATPDRVAKDTEPETGRDADSADRGRDKPQKSDHERDRA